MKRMAKKRIRGDYCTPISCDYVIWQKDTHGACYTFTKLKCGLFNKEVDKGQFCLERKVK